MCAVADRRVLRRHRLAEGLVTLCANHAAVAGRRPLTVEQLRAECYPLGDRRGSSERRSADRRVPGERRLRVDLAHLLGDQVELRLTSRRTTDAPAQLDLCEPDQCGEHGDQVEQVAC